MVSYTESSIDQIIINEKKGQSRKNVIRIISKGKMLDPLSNSLNNFCKGIYGHRSGEFIGGSWGLKGL